ncbi:NAD-dependent protein deacetylase sirtuin-2-like isoform X1 [Varroa destructor]|uniref:Deacetylase sirtuin-type domain-containing protein n=2 Tax=Varroa destructor TaxID=109461 RepID=A0A7M7M8L4_VARDE|nr:NAD-dependent protein deacetylase sirtuin-2-like isoform X1 [Varroa destructor]
MRIAAERISRQIGLTVFLLPCPRTDRGQLSASFGSVVSTTLIRKDGPFPHRYENCFFIKWTKRITSLYSFIARFPVSSQYAIKAGAEEVWETPSVMGDHSLDRGNDCSGHKAENKSKSTQQAFSATACSDDSTASGADQMASGGASSSGLLQVIGASGSSRASPLEPPSPTFSRTSSEDRTTSCLGGSCKKPHVTSPPNSPAEKDDRQKEDFISNISNYLSRKLGFSSERDHSGTACSSQPAHFLEEPTLESVVKYIQSDKCRNVIFMVGAGISTAAGIPDFRSPSMGIYSKLGRFNLPSPEAIFDIGYFYKNPAPFFELAKELMPKKLKPTKAHHFLKLMYDKGLLLRLYTQNIDTLEREAGIPDAKLVEAHGTFHTSHCLDCHEPHTFEWMKAEIAKPNNIPKCKKCKGIVKPDIVFFGENLPERFYRLADEDFAKCDLLVIIGTSLQVQPFAGLVDRVHSAVPRLLINLEKCGHSRDLVSRLLGFGCGLDFDSENNYRDVALLGTCDDGCEELARRLGWQADLKRVIADYEKSLLAD